MEIVLISKFGLYDMQTFLKVFQTGSIPRRTPDQVRYHYIVKTLYKMHTVLICSTHLQYSFDAVLKNSATPQSSVMQHVSSSSLLSSYRIFFLGPIG